MRATSRQATTLLAASSQRVRQRFGDRRFWIVQAMMGAVTVALGFLQTVEPASRHALGAAYFIPASLYFFPVLYASLNFGKEGAVPTAVWSVLLSLPSLLIWHSGLERMGLAFQMAVILAMAILVAGKVDQEAAARREAEGLERRRRQSEVKYRALFDVAGKACLVLHPDGAIHEANSAAAELFGRSLDELKAASIEGILGEHGRELLAWESSAAPPEMSYVREDGREIWIQPACAVVPTGEGALIQAVLTDVTQRRYLEDFAGAFVSAEDLHRQRLSHELCDVSLQALVVLWRNLETVCESAGDDLPETVMAALAEARESTTAVVDQLRGLSRDLCPTVLDDLGLPAATGGLVNELLRTTSARGRLMVVGPPRRLSRDTEISLFRVAQEALSNIRLHAEATRFSVGLLYGSDVELVVADNGKGFAVPSYGALVREQRLGLLGMHHRAALAGGSCRIFSRPGEGTRIKVTIPAESARPVVGRGADAPSLPSATVASVPAG